MYNADVINRFVEMKAKNIPQEKIAEELKVSERTLTNWNSKYLNDILLRKQLELEELKKSLNIADEQMLEFYSKIFEKLKNVYLNKNFEHIMTSELIKILKLIGTQIQKFNYIDLKKAKMPVKEEKNNENMSLPETFFQKYMK